MNVISAAEEAPVIAVLSLEKQTTSDVLLDDGASRVPYGNATFPRNVQSSSCLLLKYASTQL